jgi:hypothetical protein
MWTTEHGKLIENHFTYLRASANLKNSAVRREVQKEIDHFQFQCFWVDRSPLTSQTGNILILGSKMNSWHTVCQCTPQLRNLNPNADKKLATVSTMKKEAQKM